MRNYASNMSILKYQQGIRFTSFPLSASSFVHVGFSNLAQSLCASLHSFCISLLIRGDKLNRIKGN